ncbi:MAG: beta-galactosidase [Chloroflexia bacterium]|nr:beta-galactosidase [Chloroflexia bacterium]
MIEVRDKRIVIDGTPRLLISGEIHYFRLKRDEWDDRIVKLKAAGGNTVASYIPWLCHELETGEIDLDGHTRPELNLGAFIDLCASHDMYFFARPGPFIMAEMKNEGIPYRLYEDHPELVPVGWDGDPAPVRTLDYLAPAFLEAARGWYEHVIPVIASRQIGTGGNVIALQLDNEIGMLSWVTNTPDLTDFVIADFRDWLVARDDYDAAATYGNAVEDLPAFARLVRSPGEDIAGDLMHDFGHSMRNRFARYVAELRRYAEEFGISGIPYIINIHGTEAGGGASFPIGISQLYESYTQAPGYLAGSDHYLGDLTGVNAPDLYLMNAFMEAVNGPDQPLTSVEFEAGEGDYGSSMSARLDPSAADFKLRMCVAQGNRLINYYLFTGGVNYRLDRVTGDGNDRISFTGERHGVNAPVNPEGEENYTLPRLARTNRMLGALGPAVATATEERDRIAVGFIPDYWMTESVYPGNGAMGEIAENLKRHRFGGPGGVMARAMLHLTYRYTAVNIQDGPLDVAVTPVLALASARYMDAAVQRKLVDWLQAGGQLFLHGEVPLFDMTGEPCTILMDALGLHHVGLRWADHRYFLSVNADGWAAPRPELRARFAQTFAPLDEGTLFRVYGTDEACAFDIPVGDGRAIVVSAEIPADLDYFRKAFARLGVEPGLTHDHPLNGIFLSSAATPDGARFVHALNLDGIDKAVHLFDEGEPLFEGRPVMLRRRDGVMLPVDLDLGDVRVAWSTAEIVEVRPDGIMVRLTGDSDALSLVTKRTVVASPDYDAMLREGNVLVTSRIRGTGEELLRIDWL